MHEWPLLLFTLLLQASIGCTVVTLLYKTTVLSSINRRELVELIRPAITYSFLFVIAALVAFIIQSDNLFDSIYSMIDLQTSLSSREVFLTLLYSLLLLFSLIVLFASRRIPVILLSLSALVGLADVYAMSAIYSDASFNLANGWFTFSGFYSTTLILGGVVSGYIIFPALQTRCLDLESQKIVRLSLDMMVIGIFLLLVSIASLGILLPSAQLNLMLIHFALLTLSVLFMMRVLCKPGASGSMFLFTLAMLSIVSGEVLGRYLFFNLAESY